MMTLGLTLSMTLTAPAGEVQEPAPFSSDIEWDVEGNVPSWDTEGESLVNVIE